MHRSSLAVAAALLLGGCIPIRHIPHQSSMALTPEARVAQLLRAHPLVDGHNDLMGHYHACGKACPRGLDGYDIRASAAGDTDIPRGARVAWEPSCSTPAGVRTNPGWRAR